jgi:hypothetical protein
MPNPQENPEPSTNGNSQPENLSDHWERMFNEFLQGLRDSGFTVSEIGPSRTGTSQVSFVPARRTTTPPPDECGPEPGPGEEKRHREQQPPANHTG